MRCYPLDDDEMDAREGLRTLERSEYLGRAQRADILKDGLLILP